MLALSADLDVKKYAYPAAKKVDVVDDYHGTKVADPYRWLEDTNSPETKEWVEAENKVTAQYFAQIPQRAKIHARLTELFNYARYNSAFEVAGKYFFFRNNGLQNQDVLYVADKPEGGERALLDPNTLRADGTAALSGLSVDRNAKLLAYAIAQAGSDWSEWHVRDIATGKDLPDSVQWTKFTSAEWTADGHGFYYQRFPTPDSKAALTESNKNAQLYLHRLGEPQSSDKLIYQRPDHPNWLFSATVSEDGRYLVIHVETGDAGKNMLFYQDLKSPESKVVELIHELTAQFRFLGNQGSTFYLFSTDGRSKGRVIAIDVNRPEHANWKVAVPEQAETLSAAQYVDGKLILSYLKDAHSVAKIASVTGKTEHELALPGLGTSAFSHAHSTDTELIYSFDSYTAPLTFYRYDLKSNRSTLLRESKLSFDPSLYETEQVFYKSKDGTRVPMFLVHKKGLKRNGQNPTLLYAYGGFNVALTPNFSPTFLGWVEMGGVLAVCEPARRIGIRRSLAPGGYQAAQAECFRRFHRRRRVFNREQIYFYAEARDLWRE